jgi:hypothetical protein
MCDLEGNELCSLKGAVYANWWSETIYELSAGYIKSVFSRIIIGFI